MDKNITPRIIRLKQALSYLGMSHRTFSEQVRPFLTEIPIGKRGIGFDRLDLDSWLEEHKQRNGRPAQLRSFQRWDVKEHRASTKEGPIGSSTKCYLERDFGKVLELTLSKKQKNT